MLKGDGSMKRVIALIAAIALLISGVVMSVFNVFQKDQLDDFFSSFSGSIINVGVKKITSTFFCKKIVHLS